MKQYGCWIKIHNDVLLNDIHTASCIIRKEVERFRLSSFNKVYRFYNLEVQIAEAGEDFRNNVRTAVVRMNAAKTSRIMMKRPRRKLNVWKHKSIPQSIRKLLAP